jgi:hypothetical protein
MEFCEIIGNYDIVVSSTLHATLSVTQNFEI